MSYNSIFVKGYNKGSLFELNEWDFLLDEYNNVTLMGCSRFPNVHNAKLLA